MIHHIANSYKKSFDFESRSTRSEYFTFTIFVTAISFALALVNPFLGLLVSVIHFPACLAAIARRLRDAGFSPWWAIVNLVPILNYFLIIPLRRESKA